MTISSAWPDQGQLTLLKAALLPAEEAITYWLDFTASHNLQELDHGCTQVLPMVYINLNHLMQPDVNEKVCRSMYKYVWANNHLLMHDTKALLSLLNDNQIDVCLLKGAAFVAHYYQEYGMRILGDVDILVSPEKLPVLIDILHTNHYKVKSHQGEVDAHNLFRILHAKSFVNYRNTEFDVHQYLSPFLVDSDFTRRVWENKRSPNLFGQQNVAYVLSPTHHLLHTILHGLQYAPVSSIRWIVDSVNLLNNSTVEIDWNEFISICDRYHLNLPAGQAVPFIADEFGVSIPDDVIVQIKNKSITDKDRKYFMRSGNLGFRNIIDRVNRSWEHYKIYSSTGKDNAKNEVDLHGFYKFLLVYFDIKSPWMLVPHLISKLSRVAYQSTRTMLKQVFRTSDTS